MKIKFLLNGLTFVIFSIALLESCSRDPDGNGVVEIPEFNFPTSISFEQNLSTYNVFQGDPSDLVPSDDFHLMELNSVLFTDYSEKQRLVKVPQDQEILKSADGSLDFPDGAILVKTFYYFNDKRDTTLGKRLIESRLMIKEAGLWNIATYLWNDAQTDATLLLDGLETNVAWINENGENRATVYSVPKQNECVACHQSNSTTIPLGTTLRNLNRDVERGGSTTNQIEHLQAVGVLENIDIGLVGQIVDYKDISASLEDRGRAYLDLNCAHCHNPNAWDEAASQNLDFRYETAFDQTGIDQESNRIETMVSDGEMPFIGTTMLDDEGVQLMVDYINSL